MAVKRVDKDFEIAIANNFRGSFFYASPTGDFVIDMDEYGDEDYVTFGDLKALMSRNRKFLTDLNIIIIDAVGEDFSLEDVIVSLKLQDTYNELLSLDDIKLSEVDSIDIEMISDFVREAKPSRIAKILENKKSKLRLTIAETCIHLYKEGELSDYNIMKEVAEKLGHKDVQAFWTEIEASNR